MIKCFYKNVQIKVDHDKVLKSFAKYKKKMFEAKMKYILNITKQLEDLNAPLKAYRILLKRLLNSKKDPCNTTVASVDAV